MDETLARRSATKVDRGACRALALRRVEFAFGELTLTRRRGAHRRRADLPARRSRLPVHLLHRHLAAPTIPSARSASTSSTTCCRRSRTAASASRSRPTRTTPVATAIVGLSRRRLVRARDLRSVRHSVRRPSGPAPHSHRLWLRRPSAAQGFPDDRLRRSALRRRGEARALRAGAAHPGIPRSSISSARGKAPPLPGDEKATGKP